MSPIVLRMFVRCVGIWSQAIVTINDMRCDRSSFVRSRLRTNWKEYLVRDPSAGSNAASVMKDSSWWSSNSLVRRLELPISNDPSTFGCNQIESIPSHSSKSLSDAHTNFPKTPLKVEHRAKKLPQSQPAQVKPPKLWLFQEKTAPSPIAPIPIMRQTTMTLFQCWKLLVEWLSFTLTSRRFPFRPQHKHIHLRWCNWHAANIPTFAWDHIGQTAHIRLDWRTEGSFPHSQKLPQKLSNTKTVSSSLRMTSMIRAFNSVILVKRSSTITNSIFSRTITMAHGVRWCDVWRRVFRYNRRPDRMSKQQTANITDNIE